MAATETATVKDAKQASLKEKREEKKTETKLESQISRQFCQ